MGTDNINVGKKAAPREFGPPSERLFRSGDLPDLRIDNHNPSQHPSRPRPKICGAMAQQGGDGGRGNQSSPQKLVHLVGCREPKDPETNARDKHPSSAKR